MPENNKKEQEAALTAGGRGAPPAEHLPGQVVTKNQENLKIDGVKLEVLHWAPAHTNGDLVIYLPGQKIVFTGDIIAGQRPDPLIHLEKNGSSEGWITTTKGSWHVVDGLGVGCIVQAAALLKFEKRIHGEKGDVLLHAPLVYAGMSSKIAVSDGEVDASSDRT